MTTFHIRGVRGGETTPGAAFLRYGGYTTCFSLRTDRGLIIIDAGSGLSYVDREMSGASVNLPITFLFTHFHHDHLAGLPFFRPLYRKNVSVRLMADPGRSEDWRQAIRTYFAPPYWPIEMAKASAALQFEDLPRAGHAEFYGTEISWCPVRHPQQCLAYRLDIPGSRIVVATDHECGDPKLDSRFLDFCRGADVLIYDAQYTPEEYPARRGWGHSTWQEGVGIARAAGVRDLILTHHDRMRTDDEQDRIIAAARAAFPNARGAVDNMVVAP